MHGCKYSAAILKQSYTIIFKEGLGEEKRNGERLHKNTILFFSFDTVDTATQEHNTTVDTYSFTKIVSGSVHNSNFRLQ